MSDPTADKTEHSFVDDLDDDDVDQLLDRLAERADERDLQLPGGGASRRGVLAALLGAGGIGAAASQAAAIGENESYGSATGVAGTDSEPLNEANVQDLHAQDLQVDNLLEAERIAITDTLIDSGLSYGIGDSASLKSDPSDVSQNSFITIANFSGAVVKPAKVPAGATLEANLIVAPKSVPTGETGTYRVEVVELDIGGGAASTELTALDVDVTAANTTESGWQPIQNEITDDRYISARRLLAKVTNGTLESSPSERFALLFRWVVD